MTHVHPHEPTIPVKPAATVVIFRKGAAPDGNHPTSPKVLPPEVQPPEVQPEVLMVQRAADMRFAGGAAVFPGGRVDDADRALADVLIARDALAFARDEAAARIAAVRETLEETGLAIALDRPVSAADAARARQSLLAQGTLAPVLEEMGWRLMLDALVPFARWCPKWANAYDTRFYLFDLGTGAVETRVDATENTRLFWTSARGALSAAEQGEISVIFPTHRNLDRLALFASFAEAKAQALAHPVQVIWPEQVERDGKRYLTIPKGRGYPVTEQDLSTVKRG